MLSWNDICDRRITFEKLAVREESSAGQLAEQAIGQTFLPSHLAQAEADRPAVVAAATMAALQQQAAFARDVRQPALTSHHWVAPTLNVWHCTSGTYCSTPSQSQFVRSYYNPGRWNAFVITGISSPHGTRRCAFWHDASFTAYRLCGQLRALAAQYLPGSTGVMMVWELSLRSLLLEFTIFSCQGILYIYLVLRNFSKNNSSLFPRSLNFMICVAQEALSQDADAALRTPGAAQQVLAAVESATAPLESHPVSGGAEIAPKKAAAESYSMPRSSSSATA